MYLPTQLERTTQFARDGRKSERGWACTPHPHQAGMIWPSRWNVRKKVDNAALCTLWFKHSGPWSLPVSCHIAGPCSTPSSPAGSSNPTLQKNTNYYLKTEPANLKLMQIMYICCTIHIFIQLFKKQERYVRALATVLRSQWIYSRYVLTSSMFCARLVLFVRDC